MRLILLSLYMMSSITAAVAQTGFDNDFNPLPESSPAPANVGSGGVQLNEIPIALSSRCQSVLLRGASDYSNTAFLMPQAQVAVDEFNENLIEAVKIKGTDKYNLRITMSFAEVIQDMLSENSIASKVVGCDYEAIKFRANNHPTVNGDIKTIATLPVSNMFFEFNLNGKVFKDRLGTDETNSLDYLKKENILEFEVTQEDLDDFLELVNGQIGLNMVIDVNFTAKRKVGGVQVVVDNKAIANDIEGKLGINVDSKTLPKKIAAADLRAAIASSINSSNVQIIVEGGARERSQFFEISQRILMGVLRNGGLGASSGLDMGYGGDYDPYTGGYGTGTSSETTIDKWRRNRKGSIFGGGSQLPCDPMVNDCSGMPPADSGAVVDAKAFLASLRDQKNLAFKYDIMGDSEIFSYRTDSHMKLNLGDLDLRRARFSTTGPKSLPWALKAGESFTFFLNKKVVNKIDYVKRKNYFNKSDIMNNDGLKDIFEVLKTVDDSKIDIVKELNEEKAVFNWSKRYMVNLYPSLPLMFPARVKGQYYWGAYTYEIQSRRVLDKSFRVNSVTELEGLPLKFAFSKLGGDANQFPLKKMMQPNKYFSLHFDDFTGAVTIKAKRTLGTITVFNEGENQVIPRLELTSGYFQEYKGTQSSSFEEEEQFRGKFPTQEEIIEITMSRDFEFYDDEEDDFLGNVLPF